MATSLQKWIDACQARGRYTFVRGDAVKESGLSPEAVKKALQRLVKRGRVAGESMLLPRRIQKSVETAEQLLSPLDCGLLSPACYRD